MPGSKKSSILKSVDWINYILSTEIEIYRQRRSDDEKNKTHDFVWPLLSIIVAIAIVQYSKDLVNVIKLSALYIAFYFIGYKLIITNLIRLVKFLFKTVFIGTKKAEKIEKEKHADLVRHFNNIIVNKTLLSNSFKMKIEESNTSLRDVYISEALFYMKDVLFEIQNDYMDSKGIKKDLFTNQAVKSDAIMKYRLAEILKIIKSIINYIDQFEKEFDEGKAADLTIVKNRYENIYSKMEDI